MRAAARRTAGVLALGWIILAGGVGANENKATVVLVSPAAAGREAQVVSPCPTFSWSEVSGARGYRLVVFGADRDAAALGDEPLVEVELPARASSWTPGMQECLEPGRRYGWAVGLVLEEGRLRWSEVAVFQVTAGANREPDRPLARREEALEAEWTTDPAAVLAYPHGAGANLERIIDEIFSLPACVPGSEIFADVPATSPFCPFIEQAYRDQIISSCADSPLRYCPGKPVTREQLAVTIERALRGTDTFRPTGSGGDVANRPPAASAITPLDTTGNVGAFSSVTIGADGLGLI